MKEKEQQLFNEWRCEREYSSFIADGVQQPLKITFVLKEANWINGNVDLREFLLSDPKGSYWKTWNKIARWYSSQAPAAKNRNILNKKGDIPM